MKVPNIEVWQRVKWQRHARVEEYGGPSQGIKITEDIDRSSNFCIFIKITEKKGK